MVFIKLPPIFFFDKGINGQMVLGFTSDWQGIKLLRYFVMNKGNILYFVILKALFLKVS